VTIPFSGTELTIWYIDRGGPWTYRVDGARTIQVVPKATNAPIPLHVPRLSSGTHSVQIVGTAADSPWLSGIQGSNVSGTRVDNFSVAGLESGAWNNADPWHSGMLAGGAAHPADLIIYELGGNDAINAVHPVTSATTVTGRDTVTGSGWMASDIGDLVTGPGVPVDTNVVSLDPARGSATLSHPLTQTVPKTELIVTAADAASAWSRNIQDYLKGLQRNPSTGAIVPDVIFLWPPLYDTPEIQQRYAQLRDQSLAIAKSAGAAYIDITAMTGKPWSSWCKAGRAGKAQNPAEAGWDYAHPSDAGHRYIADSIMTVIG
jgi:lysophospholipase L1-like esterase